MSDKNYIATHPDLIEICKRLRASFLDAKQKNKELEEKELQEAGTEYQGKRNKFRYTPEHVNISEYFKGNRWEKTIFLPKAGDTEFVKMFNELVSLRSPEAIKVEIFRAKGEKRAMPIWEKEIWLEGEPKTPKNEGTLGAVVNNAMNAVMEKIEQLKTQPENGSVSNATIELLQKDFQMQLKTIQHENELNQLRQQHAGEIKELKNTIADLNDEVADLNDELDEYEEGLDGIQSKVKEVQDPQWVKLLGRIGQIAGEGILKENPKLLSIGLKLSDAEIADLWKDEAKSIEQTNDASSFSEAANEYEGIDEKQVEGIKQLIAWMKTMPLDVFKKIHWLLSKLQKEDGAVNVPVLDQVIRLFSPPKKEEPKPEEKPKTETAQ